MRQSAQLPISENDLVEIASPYVEPRLAFQSQVPRKGDNLTLIDGKTFLSTNVAGDIVPAGAPDVGFFHDDRLPERLVPLYYFYDHFSKLINGRVFKKQFQQRVLAHLVLHVTSSRSWLARLLRSALCMGFP